MMTTVDWTPLVATAAGAAIAFSGTVIADLLRRRDSRHRHWHSQRHQAYLEMMLALGSALEGLRGVAAADTPHAKMYDGASKAVSKAGVYVARERMLMTATWRVAQAAESAFDALIEVRNAVRRGARLRTAEFHDAYHPYAEQMWRLRVAIRDDLGAPRLRAIDLNRENWSGRATCTICNPAAAVAVAPNATTTTVG